MIFIISFKVYWTTQVACTSTVGKRYGFNLLIYSFIAQTETMEADGFQADTEDDDDEDCVLISTQSGELHGGNTNISLWWFKRETASLCYFLCNPLCVSWSQADNFFKTGQAWTFKSQRLKQGSISQDWLLTQCWGNDWPYCMTYKNLPPSILFNPHGNQEVVWLGSAYANHILVSVFMFFTPAVFRILLSALLLCIFLYGLIPEFVFINKTSNISV